MNYNLILQKKKIRRIFRLITWSLRRTFIFSIIFSCFSYSSDNTNRSSYSMLCDLRVISHHKMFGEPIPNIFSVEKSFSKKKKCWKVKQMLQSVVCKHFNTFTVYLLDKSTLFWCVSSFLGDVEKIYYNLGKIYCILRRICKNLL